MSKSRCPACLTNSDELNNIIMRASAFVCTCMRACGVCVCVCVCECVCVCVCVCVCLGGDRGGRVSDNFWLPTSTTNWDLACLQSSRTLMQSWISPKWPFDRFFYVFSLFRDVVYKFQPHKFSQNFLWFQSSKILKHSYNIKKIFHSNSSFFWCLSVICNSNISYF